jgi:hypothetical protein
LKIGGILGLATRTGAVWSAGCANDSLFVRIASAAFPQMTNQDFKNRLVGKRANAVRPIASALEKESRVSNQINTSVAQFLCGFRLFAELTLQFQQEEPGWESVIR